MKFIKYLFALNPISGGKDKSSFYEFLEDENILKSIDYEIFTTTGQDDLYKLKKLIRRQRPEVIVAVGGDGTLRLAAEVAKNSSIKVGLIPFGSANGMAKELQIPKITEPALSLLSTERFNQCWKIIQREKITELDLLEINKRFHSIHLSDIGLNAKIVKRFEEERIRGYWGYARLFIKELKQKKRISYQVFANGIRYKGKAYMIVIANATMYGTGAIINPVGKPDDGIFEICLVRQVKLLALIRSFFSVFKGSLRKRSDLIKVVACKRASIELKRKQVLQVDGEVVGPCKKIEIKILKKAVKMIV